MSQEQNATIQSTPKLPKLWRWAPGRQDSGYDTFPLAISKFFRCDCYLIRYRKGAGIPPHRDKVAPGNRHFRLNIILWPARKGGDLSCEWYLFRFGPIKLFRPDLAEHSVSPVEEGVRYVLSFGWLRKDPSTPADA
jgi:hypothetical protein